MYSARSTSAVYTEGVDGDFMFVGERYVHGVMNGQGLTHLKEELRDMGHIMPMNALGVCSAPLEEFRIGNGYGIPVDE
jgi:hypothetical protein